MTALDNLKEFVEQRLATAVEEIFEYFQKTINEYEVELDRCRKLLDIALLPEIRLRREDAHYLTVNAKAAPEQQGTWPSVHQEDPQPSHIKEEQEEQGLQGADILLPLVSVKDDEDDQEIPQLSQLRQSQTEENAAAHPPAMSPADQMETAADGDDCEGSEPASDSQAQWDNGSSVCSEPEINSKEDFNRFNGGEVCKPFSCLLCDKHFCSQSELARHERGHTGPRSLQQGSDSTLDTGEKPFRCSDCGECFSHRAPFKQHITRHKAEKPLGVSACDRRFTRKSQIKTYESVGRSSSRK